MTENETCDPERLVLSGACTIRTVDEVYARLIATVARSASVAIDCDAVDEVDLSFVQLLIAARASARIDGRSVNLARPASGALLDALKRGGFLSSHDPASREFWLRAGS